MERSNIVKRKGKDCSISPLKGISERDVPKAVQIIVDIAGSAAATCLEWIGAAAPTLTVW
jgi:hypothetical protein